MQPTREPTTTSTMAIPSMTPGRARRVRARTKRVNTVAGQKWCSKCKTRKPLDAFGVARDRGDGVAAYCRACKSAARRAARAANPEKHRAECRARYAANPLMWHAHVAVARAVARGILQKPAPGSPCVECGRIAPLEAHHYRGVAREHWLDVQWCCRSCHHVGHSEQRITDEQTQTIQPTHKHPTYPKLRAVPPRWASHGTDGVRAVVPD